MILSKSSRLFLKAQWRTQFALASMTSSKHSVTFNKYESSTMTYRLNSPRTFYRLMVANRLWCSWRHSTVKIYTIVSTVANLTDIVFPTCKDIKNYIFIFSPNNFLAKLNEDLRQRLSGELRVYMSVDTLADPEEVVNFPTEFLN